MNDPQDFRANSEYLRNRYGISLSRRPKWLVPAFVIALTGGSWLAWSANHYSQPEIRSSLISFAVVDDAHISVRYSLHFKDASTSHSCLLTAKDYGANVVGQITDAIPTGTNSLTREVIIPTRLRAVNAGIEKCF
jgi:hypothetical protein